MAKASTNVRIYKETHKIIKKLAKEHHRSLASMIHEISMLVENANYEAAQQRKQFSSLSED